MRVALELIEGLRYKLRIIRSAIEEQTSVFCDNQAVVSTASESTLKKKHVALNYHRVCEAVAAATVRIAKEDTAGKCLAGPRKRAMAGRILW
jgi:hypothetical protein